MSGEVLDAEVVQIGSWGMTEPVLTVAHVPDCGAEDED